MLHYGADHPDYLECEDAKQKLFETTRGIPDLLLQSVNFSRLSCLITDFFKHFK